MSSVTMARPEGIGSTAGLEFQQLASAITWEASKQTYTTVRLLVDQDRVDDAYRAYGYFRWVDDHIDRKNSDGVERTTFVRRQSALIEQFKRGEAVPNLCPEEQLLAELMENNPAPDSGLHRYIDYMMAVMVFDAERRGRLISAVELEHYTRWLAIAVTEALHYFIGNRCGAPQNEMRHMAALGAHVTHMLRDTVEDIESGYFNMPLEVVQRAGIDAHDVYSTVYRAWVAQRVYLARQYFEAGRKHLEQVENWRCRLAGYAYITRFEIVLDLIEADNYILRRDYPERKTLNAGIKMFWGALLETLFAPKSAVSTRYMSGEIRKVI